MKGMGGICAGEIKQQIMKRLLLLFVLLFYSFSYGKSNDEIDFSLFTEQAETFVTVMNKGNKMVRWQSYTAHPLTIYQMPSHPVIAVYENPVSKTLIGLSEEELLIWKINSPEIVKRFAIKDFVPNFKKSDSGTIYLLKRNQSFLS